jgi:Ras-related protein Rab-24
MNMMRIDMKVVLLGKEYSGKTSLVERFLSERFAGENRYQNTIGAAYGEKTVNVKGKDMVLGVWDTAGSERYQAMSKMYYRNAKAAVICYAVNDAESWEKVLFWVKELAKTEPDCSIYICATKIDLVKGRNKDRCVDYHTTTDLVDSIKGKLFETSSKTGENITELFHQVAMDYLENKINHLESLDDMVNMKSEKKGRKCC